MTGDDGTQMQNSPENLRRQQMVRLVLIMFLLFLVFDTQQPPGNRTPPDNGRSSKRIYQYEEIPINAMYCDKMRSILRANPGLTLARPALNSTGLYRGKWSSTMKMINDTESIE